MNENKMEDWLESVLLEANEDGIGVDGIGRFSEEGIITKNAGVVVRMDDGSEFQITIVKVK